MSISRKSDTPGGRTESSMLDSWHDVEVQFVGTFNSIGAATTGETNSEGARVDGTFEPAEGIDRDELAELVGFRRVFVVATEPDAGDSDTEPGYLNGSAYLSKNGDFGNELPQTEGPEAEFVEWGLGTQDSSNAGTRASNRNGLIGGYLDYIEARAQAGWNDTVNGTGGGSNAAETHEHTMWFSDKMGVGPIFDTEDNVSTRVQQNRVQTSAESIARSYVYLFWRIHEGEIDITFR